MVSERLEHYKAVDKADLDHAGSCPSCKDKTRKDDLCATGRKLFDQWAEEWRHLTVEDLDMLNEGRRTWW